MTSSMVVVDRQSLMRWRRARRSFGVMPAPPAERDNGQRTTTDILYMSCPFLSACFVRFCPLLSVFVRLVVRLYQPYQPIPYGNNIACKQCVLTSFERFGFCYLGAVLGLIELFAPDGGAHSHC